MDSPSTTLNDNFLLRLLLKPVFRVPRHLILVLFAVSMVYNMGPAVTENLIVYWKTAIILMLFTMLYVNMYQLVPKLLFKNRYAEYALSVLLLGVFMFLVLTEGRNLIKPYLLPREEHRREGFNVFSFCFMFGIFIAASDAVKLFQRWVTDTQRINELERITMQSELEQLKNQINPHFLFNMLNNANVLVKKDPEKASQVLIKLSDLLRYQLYDSTRSKVLLTADIHFLTDFLNLEKTRRDNFEFIMSKEGAISGVQIAPLLFITFVENAVKHNMDEENSSYVHVFFDCSDEVLHFRCINSKPRPAAKKAGAGGLGLANVRRTLELLYPNRHQLDIEDKADSYHVNLIIRL